MKDWLDKPIVPGSLCVYFSGYAFAPAVVESVDARSVSIVMAAKIMGTKDWRPLEPHRTDAQNIIQVPDGTFPAELHSALCPGE